MDVPHSARARALWPPRGKGGGRTKHSQCIVLAALFTILPATASAAGGSPTAQSHNAEREAAPKPWSVLVGGGVQALGFHPFARSPTVSVGAQRSLLRRGRHQLGIGAALSGFSHPLFARGTLLDASLFYRGVAPWGVYVEPDLVVGGRLSRHSGGGFTADKTGQFVRTRGGTRLSARIGLGLALGLDLSALSRTPLRVFVRYRQCIVSPFMADNDVPNWGLATISAGLALKLGSRR